MPENLVTHKCPSCAGQLKYDIESGKFLCSHCGNSYDDEEIRGSAANSDRQDDEFLERARMFMCPSCSALIMADSKYSATARCHYCDTDIVIGMRVDNDCKPDYVIPFKLTREQAKEKMVEFLQSKKYMPIELQNEEALTNFYGIYIPTWLGESEVTAEYDVQCVEGTFSYDDDKDAYGVSMDAKYYHIKRKATFNFRGIPVDAVKKLNDDFMESIEPYDYSELKEFDMMYLSGYAAERYSVPFKDVSDYLELRARREARDRIISPNRHLITKVFCQESEVDSMSAKYAMLPLYMCNIEHKGEKHTIIVNGQTGKTNGTVPVDERKVTVRNLLVAGGIAALFIAVWLILFLPMHTSGGFENGLEILKFYLVFFGILVTLYFGLLHRFREKVHKTHTRFNLSRNAAEYTISGDEKYHCDEKIFNGKYDGPRTIPRSKAVFNREY